MPRKERSISGAYPILPKIILLEEQVFWGVDQSSLNCGMESDPVPNYRRLSISPGRKQAQADCFKLAQRYFPGGEFTSLDRLVFDRSQQASIFRSPLDVFSMLFFKIFPDDMVCKHGHHSLKNKHLLEITEISLAKSNTGVSNHTNT